MIKHIKFWKLIDYVVWSLPLAALTLSVYLVVDYYSQRDIQLKIYFTDAASIEPQKTQLVYKGIVVGLVEGVQLDPKNHGVIVRATLDREAKYLATAGTRFKIVQPKVGFSGISGLETLLKGAYIKIEKSNFLLNQKPKLISEFTGVTTDEEEMQDATPFVLEAKSGKGLNVGMPLEYKGVKIGSVVSIDFESLDSNKTFVDQNILVKVGVENKYTHMINQHTRFWMRPAVSARLDLQGMNVEVSSLEALLKGGLIVETSDMQAQPVAAGHRFRLHDKKPATNKNRENAKILYLSTNDAESVQKQDPIFYRGIKTGEIQSVRLSHDGSAVIEARIDEKFKHLVKQKTVFWKKPAVDSKFGWSGLSLKVSSLESLVRGGINFATPTDYGGDIKKGALFLLQDSEPKDEKWKDWKPVFPKTSTVQSLSSLYE